MLNQFRKSPVMRGLSLLEVVISIAILGILLAGFIPAMMGATRMSISTDEKETAKNLAESQMEYLLVQDYQSSYTPYADYSSQYPGFTVDNITVTGVSNRDNDIQSITVTVRRSGVIAARLSSFKTR
jgi:prepilin-type N-terminal cleavage/methylation domain-containing protein